MTLVRKYTFTLLLLALVGPNLFAQEFEDGPTEPTQQAWMEQLAAQKSLESHYVDRSGLLMDGKLYQDLAAIQQQLVQEFPEGFASYEAMETHQLRPNRKFVYGRYQAPDGTMYASVIGWRKHSRWFKEFEAIYPEGSSPADAVEQADRLRDQWVDLANKHVPAKIGTDVFSSDGMYFNRGTRFSSDQIGQAYSYMSNKSFSIGLEALMVKPINDSITYEFGIFDSGGRGLYVLIWTNTADGWRLLLDFNF